MGLSHHAWILESEDRFHSTLRERIQSALDVRD